MLQTCDLHIGTFHVVVGGIGTFDSCAEKVPYLRDLGINAIELMPLAEFAGDYSWGYNPAHPFAIETAYGGPAGLKRFIRKSHQHGLAVIIDVVYNHFGPSDLDLWQFDGWSEHGKGGIYFYNDWRSPTPWGDTPHNNYWHAGKVRTMNTAGPTQKRWQNHGDVQMIQHRHMDGAHAVRVPQQSPVLAVVNDLVISHPATVLFSGLTVGGVIGWLSTKLK